MKIYQHLLLVVDLRAGPGHEVEGEPDEGHDPQQVGPDVAGLGVDPGSQSQLSIHTDSSQSQLSIHTDSSQSRRSITGRWRRSTP